MILFSYIVLGLKELKNSVTFRKLINRRTKLPTWIIVSPDFRRVSGEFSVHQVDQGGKCRPL